MAKPLHPRVTYIKSGAPASDDDLRRRVVDIHQQHGPLIEQYHELWYRSLDITWGSTRYLGVPLMKSPNDLWIYQELFTLFRFQTVIECGTYAGGSALWYASLMDALGMDDFARVHSIDIDHTYRRVQKHRRIAFYDADSTDPKLVARLVKKIKRPLLVVLDSEHSYAHVSAELATWAPHCVRGDWMVVEDTNVSFPQDSGAGGALREFLRDPNHRHQWRQEPLCERYLLTMHPGGWLERV